MTLYIYRSVRQEAAGVKVVVRAGTADVVVVVVIVDGDAMMLIWILKITRDDPNRGNWEFWGRDVVRE